MVQVQDRTVSTWSDEITMHVKTAGSGPPLLFLHGAGGLRWDPFLEGLAQSYTVYAPEAPGTSPGDPDAVRKLDDLWDLVFLYSDLLDRPGLERVAVIGHSFGGMLAAELAACYPERVSKLVLIAPIGLWRDDVPIRNIATYPPEELPKVLFYDPEGEGARMVLAMLQEGEEPVEAQARFIWAIASTIGKFAWPIPDKGLKKRIYRIRAPTLIVWGKDDRLVPPMYADEFARRIPGARVALVERAGHLPQLEQLGQVLETVRQFLASPQ